MKNTLLAITILCLSYSLHSQNLAGHWTGQLYQNEIGWYDFELQLTTTSDSTTYTGTSYISSKRGSGTLAVTATLEGTVFHFQESKVRDQHWNTVGWYWCIKAGDLQLTERIDSLILAGDWQAPGTCKPGTIRVTKVNKARAKVSAKPESSLRKVETKEVVQVVAGEVLVEIWDHEKEDGDIASISLNGEVILKNHLVTVQKHQFRMALQPGKNMLVLFAENLGTRPPNTAAITIFYDGKTKTVVLNSDKTKSEAIEINH